MRKLLTYSAVLIGVYVVVANATGFGKAVTALGSGASEYAKTLQGR